MKRQGPARRHGARERRARARAALTGPAPSGRATDELARRVGREDASLAPASHRRSCAGSHGWQRCSPLFPAVRRALPEAELPFRQGRVDRGDGRRRARCDRRSVEPARPGCAGECRRPPGARAGDGLRCAEPSIAAYHGAEHISIGSYEHDEPRPREHERCGSHCSAPLLVATVAGNVLAGRLAATPRGRVVARLVAGLGAVAASTELYGWTLRNPDEPGRPRARLARPPAAAPLLTAEPTPEQLEVAEAALAGASSSRPSRRPRPRAPALQILRPAADSSWECSS